MEIKNEEFIEQEEIDEFDNTVVWGIEEERLRSNRSEGIPGFYLIIGAIIIFLICVFILYFANKRKKIGALDMIKDPNNVFEEYTQDEENNDDNVPLIDISEEDVKSPVSLQNNVEA